MMWQEPTTTTSRKIKKHVQPRYTCITNPCWYMQHCYGSSHLTARLHIRFLDRHKIIKSPANSQEGKPAGSDTCTSYASQISTSPHRTQGYSRTGNKVHSAMSDYRRHISETHVHERMRAVPQIQAVCTPSQQLPATTDHAVAMADSHAIADPSPRSGP